METILQAILIVGGGVAAALGGLWFVRKSVGPGQLQANHDVAGYIVAVVGVMYGVLLASVVIVVWTQFDHSRNNVAQEAGAVGSIIRLSRGLDTPIEQDIVHAAHAYAFSVVQDEWPALARADLDSISSERMDEFWRSVRDFVPSDDDDMLLKDKMLDLLNQLTQLRRQRFYSSTESLSMLLWLVLIAGAAITVVFCYFFGVEHPKLHHTMVGLLALMICLNLFLIAALDQPFSGLLQLSTRPYEQLVERLVQ